MKQDRKQIALVTGASSGMGRCFVRKIAENYPFLHEIWVIARREEALDALQKELPETEIIDPKEVRRRAGRVRKGGAPEKGRKERPMPKKGPSAKRHDMEEVDKMLLTQSLKNDLDLGE